MIGADLVSQVLLQENTEYVFGVPGDTSTSLYDALCRAGRLNHIFFRDERSAAFAADAYARVKGQVGVVDVPSGAGALYVAGGISEAQKSCIGLLCIATDIPLSSDETEALTEINQEAFFGSIAKWCVRVKAVDKLHSLLLKGFRLSSSGRPGATVVSIPENILNSDVTVRNIDSAQPEVPVFPKYRPNPASKDIESLLRLLAEADRPVVLCGGGVITSRACEDLSVFSERTGIPVATSINGKGAISEFSRHSIGVVGANGGRPGANTLLSMADMVLILGSKINRVTTLGGSLLTGKTLCQVDIDPQALENNATTHSSILSDARELLRRLNEATAAGDLSVRDSWKDWSDYASGVTREELDADFKEKARHSGTPISPYRVIEALQNVLPEHSIIVADAGTPTPFVSAYYRVATPGRRVISPRGHGGLGYALPATIGVKLASPDTPVIGMFGDGSFGMSMGDLETIHRLGLPIVLMNFQNGCYGWIKALQKLYHGGRYYSVDFAHVDNGKIAEAFGVKTVRVEDPGSLEQCIADAINSDGPVFLNVLSASPLQVTPPVAKWLRDETLEPSERQRLTY